MDEGKEYWMRWSSRNNEIMRWTRIKFRKAIAKKGGKWIKIAVGN